MNFFKLLIVFFLQFTFLSQFVYGPFITNPFIKQQMIIDHTRCWSEITVKFGNHTDQMEHAKFAFDNFILHMTQFNDNQHSYYKEFEFKIRTYDTILNPKQFCERRHSLDRSRNIQCFDSPLDAIIDKFYKHRRQILYCESNGMQIYNIDLVDYWDHLKNGFYLEDFPELELFCENLYPVTKYINLKTLIS